MTPTNHPVSQAEASDALRWIGMQINGTTESAKTHEARDTLRRYIAQAGAPEGQAVAWQFRNMDDHGNFYPHWHDCSKEQFAYYAPRRDCETRILYTHPIPRASSAGVRVPDVERMRQALMWLAYSADPEKLTAEFAIDHAKRALTPTRSDGGS